MKYYIAVVLLLAVSSANALLTCKFTDLYRFLTFFFSQNNFAGWYILRIYSKWVYWIYNNNFWLMLLFYELITQFTCVYVSKLFWPKRISCCFLKLAFLRLNVTTVSKKVFRNISFHCIQMRKLLFKLSLWSLIITKYFCFLCCVRVYCRFRVLFHCLYFCGA